MSKAKVFSILFSIGLFITVIGNFVFQAVPSCNALSVSESSSVTQEEDTDAIDIKDGKRIFVSSFVVNGVDLGAGYFYTSGPVSGCYSYHFFDESGEETICYKVDSYTIDTDKQQVEDERYTQAVKDQINTEVNSFAPNIWTNLVVGLLCIAGFFIVWFILSTLFG